MAADDYDAIIIGAGAAGLAASRALADAGRSVALLEARDRLGGRLHAIDEPRALAPIELGAEFVHGRPAVTYRILHEFDATVVDNAETGFAFDGATLRAQERDPFEATSVVLARALDDDCDVSVAELVRRYVACGGSSDAAEATLRLVAGFDAADPARASARALAKEWCGDASADGAQARPIGGYARLVAHLARSLGSRVDVRANSVAMRVSRDAEGVTVAVRSGSQTHSLRARYAIVTVPVGVLQAQPGEDGAIAFHPKLPDATLDAIARLAMGPVVKVVLRFKEPVWETLANGAWRDGAFFSGDGAFPTLWTQTPIRAKTLVAWAGGPAADALADMTLERRIDEALNCAARYFGDPSAVRSAFEEGYCHDWQRDPLARGAYSYALVGGEDAAADLAEAVDGRIWFAGEATATDGEGGTVAGALESGIRAAEAILAAG
jgi:monoamine oxidase